MLCICKKAELGAKLMGKIHLSFASKLLLPSATLTNGSDFQFQRPLLICETFLSGFPYFLGILEVFFLRMLRFSLNNAMGRRGCSKQSSRKKSPFYEKHWLSKNCMA